MNLRSLRTLLAGLAFVAAGVQAQGQAVGRVLLAAGDAFAVRNGQQVRLQYNSPVEFKDVLRTGPASSLQVRFVDEGLISLRDNSEFAIEEYRFAGGQDDGERAFFRLLKGGFRSVTGLIGRSRNAAYRVQTQTATIGIRGTDYGVRFCAGDCGPNVKDGLYGTVHGQSSGTNQITVSNEGTPQPRTFGINQHFYVADSKTPPQPLLQPPTFVSIKPQGKAQAAQQGGSGSGGEEASKNSGAQAESRPSAPETIVTNVVTPVVPYTVVEVLNAAGTPAVLPPANGFGVFYPIGSGFEGLFDSENATATYNGQNQLLGYKFSDSVAKGALSGSVTDTGGITASNGQVFTWGRWTAGSITTKSGSVFTNVPLLFITASGLQQNSSAASIGGQGTYSLVGGPHAVDAGGNTGTVTSSSLGINFTTQSVSYSIGISFASVGTFGPAILSLSGTGGVGNGQNNGEFQGTLSGSCSGGGCLLSSVSGAFDVGVGGLNGYNFAVVGGGITNGTRAGGVAFLNGYQVSSFTPGPAPNAQNLTGEIVYANTSPSVPGATFTLSSQLSTFSGTDLISFSSPNSTLTGNLASGTIVDRGAATLIDGSSINWGRWSGATQVNDPVVGMISPSSGMPFVVGQNASVPASGSFTYSVAGGTTSTTTNPTPGVGGTVTAGTANVTFGTTSSITLSGLAFTAPSSSGTLTFSGVGGSTTFTGSVVGNLTVSGTCAGGGCSTGAPASGSASGIFVGQQAAGLALTGALSAAGNNAVFGAALKR
jgi:hypothetical protein